jgi:NAD(P)-dependent dehydrogenase (short-subunit alcohol dehydrogenase family)
MRRLPRLHAGSCRDASPGIRGLDILFVNAGIAELKPVEQWDEAAFDRSFALNMKGPYFLSEHASGVVGGPPRRVLRICGRTSAVQVFQNRVFLPVAASGVR